MGSGISMAFDSSSETSRTTRKKAFAPAMPISNHTKQCITFLFKIQTITVTGTTKDGNGDSCLEIDVCIQEDTSAAAKRALGLPSPGDAAGVNSEQLNSGSNTTHLQIQRTFKEFKKLEKLVAHWSDKHIQLHPKYGVAECTYCRHFYASETTKLWPGTLAKLTTSKRKLEEQLEVRLNDYVFHARLPRPSDLECQGFDHISSIVTRFLLKETPIPV